MFKLEKKILFVILFSTIILKLSVIIAYRLEPISLYKNRQKFYLKNFDKHTNKLELNFSEKKGYYCMVKKEIKIDDNILILPKSRGYSSFENFPLKNKLYENIINNEFVSQNLNLTTNLILATRLLFDLKANVTEIFISMKRFEKLEPENYSFEDFKKYLKSRDEFFFEFIQNLPLTNLLGQTTWSDNDIDEYKVTGFLPVIKMQIIKIFNSLIEQFKKDKILNEFTKNWFNNYNLNYFLGTYGYVISRSFKINLKDYQEHNDIYLDNSDQLSLNSNTNIELDNYGGSILIPLIELCNHYHPLTGSNNKTLKLLKINFENNEIKIKSNSNYSQAEEFSFSYSNFLSNDFFLLNYGFIIKNNPFQQFVFRFDIDDPGYKFYKKLEDSKFNMDEISLIDNEKLSINFPLISSKLCNDLSKFIQSYLEINLYFEDNEKLSKIKSLQILKNSIDDILLKNLKKYLLYFSTLQKNINSTLDGLKKFGFSIENYVENILKLDIDIKNISYKIDEITKNFNANKTNSIEQEDAQNLFNFKNLQTMLKSRLIKIFNVENIKILFSQQNIVIKEIIRGYGKNIKELKNKYI